MSTHANDCLENKYMACRSITLFIAKHCITTLLMTGLEQQNVRYDSNAHLPVTHGKTSR